jgi:hypothetical protein
MARNYKRDRGGRFARVNSIGSGRKVAAKKLSSTSRAPIPQPANGKVLVAVDSKGRVRKVSPAEASRIRADNRRLRTGVIAGAVVGGYLGAHAGIIGVGPGSMIGSKAGLDIATQINRRRRKR